MRLLAKSEANVLFIQHDHLRRESGKVVRVSTVERSINSLVQMNTVWVCQWNSTLYYTLISFSVLMMLVDLRNTQNCELMLLHKTRKYKED